MHDDELVRCPATELVERIRNRQLPAQRLMRAVLDHGERVEPMLNAYAHLDAEGALAQAIEIDRRLAAGQDPGPLAGLPVNVKDLIAVAGMPWRMGSQLSPDEPCAVDAPAVARLRAAGACIVGKTTTAELGGKAVGDSPLTGITRNPWCPARTPGGSSAGAAASVAAGMVPLALGTDGGGSLRIPAAFAGVVGFKADFGAVPVWPASATPGLAHVGPMARSLRDAALALAVIAGPDRRDPGSLAFDTSTFAFAAARGLMPPPSDDPPSLRKLTIGWCPDFGHGTADASIETACRHALEHAVAQGARVIAIAPWLDVNPAPVWRIEFYAGLRERLGLHCNDPRLDPAIAAELRRLPVPGNDELSRNAAQRQLVRERIDRLFERIDVLASPSTPTVAFDVGLNAPPRLRDCGPVDWSVYTYPFNLGGQPALSLPVGLDDEGLPIGLQLCAPIGRASLIYRVGLAIEGAIGFAARQDELIAGLTSPTSLSMRSLRCASHP